jgi:hypothetical protein
MTREGAGPGGSLGHVGIGLRGIRQAGSKDQVGKPFH